MELLKAENLIFSYPDSALPAINGVSLSVESGEFVLLMGRTGSGKSTLLKLIVKELSPHGSMEGTLSVGAKSVAFVPQFAENTFVSETVRGELAFTLENQCLSNDEISLKIGETASFFNLNEILDKRVSELSGGEKSTLAIAAAMASDADMLVLDEPLAQLDPRAVVQVISLIKRVNDELGTTVIIASHISEGIIDICDRLVVLDGGKLVANGSVDELKYREELLEFFPSYTALFEERPLTVKEAKLCQKRFKEKELPVADKSDENAVQLKNICFAYKKDLPDVFTSLNFDIKNGEIHSVIGANGSGKTTLLKVIAGIKKPYGGKVKLNGKCAYVPQNVRYLFSGDTVSDEIEESTARDFSLEKYLLKHPYDLSGGEQQLLAMAKVSEQGFDILLLDEPAKSLDFKGKALVSEYIRTLKAAGKTIVIVTHDLEFAGSISDRITFISDGISAMSGGRREVLSSLDLYTTPVRRITRSYLNSAVNTEDLL